VADLGIKDVELLAVALNARVHAQLCDLSNIAVRLLGSTHDRSLNGV